MKALEELEAVCFAEHRYRQEFLEWILKNPRTATLVWVEAGRIAGSVMILLENGQSGSSPSRSIRATAGVGSAVGSWRRRSGSPGSAAPRRPASR